MASAGPEPPRGVHRYVPVTTGDLVVGAAYHLSAEGSQQAARLLGENVTRFDGRIVTVSDTALLRCNERRSSELSSSKRCGRVSSSSSVASTSSATLTFRLGRIWQLIPVRVTKRSKYRLWRRFAVM